MPLDQPEELTGEKNLSFLQHAEELRWHILRALIGVVVGMVLVFFFLDWLINGVILAPLQPDFPMHALLCRLNETFCFEKLDVSFQATAPTEQFSKAILIGVAGGFILSFPYVIFELWRFVRPALKPQEARLSTLAVASVSGLFLTGVCFAYFVILPVTFRFLAEFQLDPSVRNIWRIGDVVGLVVQFCLAGGLLFEMPVLVYVLSRLGIVRPQLMRRYRRHAIILSLVLSGILTPSPDMMSQLLLALPLLLLYEVSISISARVDRARQARIAAEQAEFERRNG